MAETSEPSLCQDRRTDTMVFGHQRPGVCPPCFLNSLGFYNSQALLPEVFCKKTATQDVRGRGSMAQTRGAINRALSRCSEKHQLLHRHGGGLCDPKPNATKGQELTAGK